MRVELVAGDQRGLEACNVVRIRYRARERSLCQERHSHVSDSTHRTRERLGVSLVYNRCCVGTVLELEANAPDVVLRIAGQGLGQHLLAHVEDQVRLVDHDGLYTCLLMLGDQLDMSLTSEGWRLKQHPYTLNQPQLKSISDKVWMSLVETCALPFS